MNKIFIYGASGHGKVVADIAIQNGYSIEFIDDGENSYKTFDDIKENNNTPIALGIGNNFIREKIYNKLKQFGFEVKTLIHKSAIISKSAKIEDGVVIMPNVVINAESIIKKGVILNTSSIIEHENIINDFVHISPSVALAGNVYVGSNTHIGIGTCIIQNIKIGDNCIIGAGSVVVKNIENNNLAYGNPCKKVKEII